MCISGVFFFTQCLVPKSISAQIAQFCFKLRRFVLESEILFALFSSYRFGFMPCSVKVPEGDERGGGQPIRHKPAGYSFSYSSSHSADDVEENFNHQYVHCTAGMFILIPDSNPSLDRQGSTTTMLRPPRTSSTAMMVTSLIGTSPYSNSRLSNAGLGGFGSGFGGGGNGSSITTVTNSYSSASSTTSTTGAGDGTASPEPLDPVEMSKRSSADLHKLYIARQAERPEKQVGFLWTWNYMSSRRWRSSNTGDEIFQDTMLADFRRFCSNDEGRLTEFWESFKGLLDDVWCLAGTTPLSKGSLCTVLRLQIAFGESCLYKNIRYSLGNWKSNIKVTNINFQN